MSDRSHTTINEISPFAQDLHKRAGSTKGGRLNYQTFTDNKDIQPRNVKEQYPVSKQDTFEHCVAQCSEIGGSPGCSGCSYEVSSKICHLFSGELNEPVVRTGWKAARRTLKSGQGPAQAPQAPVNPDPGNGGGSSISHMAPSSEPAQQTSISQSSTITSSSASASSMSTISIANSTTMTSTSFLTSTTLSRNGTSVLNATIPTLLPTNLTYHDSSLSDIMSHHGGTIAGMLIGCMTGLALLAGLIFLFRRHRKQKRVRNSQFNVLSMKKVETADYSDQVPRKPPGEYVPITAATMAALRRDGESAPKELLGSTRMPVELPENKSKAKPTRTKAQHIAMFNIDL